jgi:DNA-directed RNA polymerase III subunit RPC6
LTSEQAAQLEKDLIAVCIAKPDGINQKQIEEALITNYVGTNRYVLVDIALAINGLVNKGRLNTFRHDNICVWKIVAEDKANKMQSLNQQERIVYQAIEKEGNMGIWIKDLRKRTNILGQGVLEKILKSMMVRKYIKAEDSIAGKNKKVYMLYELKPSLEVTGGTFYKGSDMDTEFISVMQKASRIILMRNGPQTASGVLTHIQNLKVSSVPLTLHDIATVLNTLVMDRMVEVVSHDRMEPAVRAEYMRRQEKREAAAEGYSSGPRRKRRRGAGMTSVHDSDETDEETDVEETDLEDDDDVADTLDDDEEMERVFAIVPDNSPSYVNPNFVAAPCVGCKLYAKCTPGGIIEPKTCLYFKQWLSEEF